jgi:filamentous hemagglutinin family protein
MSSHQTRTQSAQFKVRPLIGAIALALAAPAAFAAAPAAGALPGTFYSNTTANYSGSGPIATISYSSVNNVVMQWGGATSSTLSIAVSPTLASSTATAMNNVAGFNIGAGATLNITNGTAGTGLLISDVTGQASQIYGKVTASSVGALFIANANGVVLDAGGAVNNGTSGGVAFLGFAQDAATFATATTASVGVNVGAGQTLLTKGDVTVNGAVSAGTVLVAGAGNVNVAQSDAAAGWNIFAGENFTYNGGATATASGAFAGGSAAVVNLTGGASSGSSAFSGATVVAAGNVNLNNYISSFTSATIAGTLTNNGVLSASIVSAGGVVNNGEINATAASTLTATTGDVVNNGIINASGAVTFSAASTTGNVTNNGSILNAGDVTLSAGASAGTAANNGTINFAASSAALSMTGFNVNLYGTVNANVGTVATALSATNALGTVGLTAAAAGGVLNLGTTLFGATTTLQGDAVRVVSGGVNGTSVVATLGSGPVTSGSNTYGYNLSVFNGATLSAGTGGTVTIAGATGASGSNININLDGTVAGQMIDVNANNINGLGGFNITTSSGGSLTATFSGNFNAPNGAAARSGAGNFLYNYVPVNVASNGTATINLDPTNTATTAQLVNVLVNGSATVLSNLRAPVNTSGSIVAQASYPNSHLVFQATGNMTVGDTTGFYWPGLMYLGTINAGQPGSLSTLGTISLAGSLNNVIPTNVASQGGIWFMTSNPLNIATGAQVLTNTNSWINFPAATGFAAAYGAQNATSKTFYGMVPNPTVNTILNTGALASNMFYGR